MMEYFRLVSAKGFFRHKISVLLKGSGPTSSTHADIFTMTAAALVRRKISQALENSRGLPNLPQVLLLHATAENFQVAAGLYVPSVRNKTKPDSSQTSPGRGIQTMGLGHHLFLFLFAPSPLSQDSVVVRGASGLQL